MKKFLLCLVALMSLPMVAGANGPAKMDLQENERILGHYTTDDVSTEGVSIKNASGKVTVGTILESDELDIFAGGIIKSFRVGLAESTPVTKVFVVPITAGGAYGSMVSWTCNVSEVGWNVVELPTPYQLELSEGSRLIIGFEYEQTSTNKPLALVKQGDQYYDTYWYKKAGQMYRWTTAGLSSYGNLCVQCVVEKDHYPEVLIKASGLESIKFANIGDPLPFSFKVKNRGTQPLEAQALTFDVKIDDEVKATISNDEVIEPDATITIEGSLETADMVSGSHILTIDHAVAGEEYLDYVFPMNFSFMAHNGVYPRQKHLIEQLTSTYCTYCPLGISMLEILQSQRDDIIWVALHGELNGGEDPFMTEQGDSAMIYMTGGSISYPSAAFDRSTGWENDRQMVNSIGYYEEYHQEIAEELGQFFDYISEQNPSFASIIIEPEVDAAAREANIVVSGEMSTDFDTLLGEGNKLYVYLTEDSLVARQLNDGIWINEFVHNGVFRCALGSIKGVDFNKIDGGYSNEFNVTIPEDWNLNNLNVVAFIARPIDSGVYTDMSVNNAEVVKLYTEVGGVEELLNDEDAVPVEYYDIMGRRIDGIRPGINIVKMSNGTAKKVLVK